MDINFIQNIVYAILFAYFVIVLFKCVVRSLQALISKIILYFNSEKVDKEYIDYLKEQQDNAK